MERLLKQGNTIYLIICKSDFQVCFNNPKHKEMDCKVCYSRVNKGIEVLRKNVLNNANLHILKYNEFLKLKSSNYLEEKNKNINYIKKLINYDKKFYEKTINSMIEIKSTALIAINELYTSLIKI